MSKPKSSSKTSRKREVSSSDWDFQTDFLVVGSGAAGLSAAVTARRNGLSVIVTESTDKWGGTTGISGGGLWMPNNPLMQDDHDHDSFDEALHYMDELIPEEGPWVSAERKRAFLIAIPQFVRMMASEGVRWTRAKDYPDYYPDLPGAKVGRGIEVEPYNIRRLGEWRKTMRYTIPAPVKTDDVWLLSRAWSTPSGFIRGVRFVFRALAGLITGQLRVGMGGAYTGSLMEIILKYRTPVWLKSPLEELIVEDGRVVGAVVRKKGRLVRVRAWRGVMLAAGGFAQHKQWRKKYHGVEGWSSAPDGQLGQGITAGEEVGGALALMDDAWWGATAKTTDGSTQHGFILNERSDPWSIVVDQEGNRYLNESESYIDFGHHMLEHHQKTKKAIPSWLVMDNRHTMSFLNSTLMIPGAVKKLKAMGELVEAENLEELAIRMGMNKDAFMLTIERFNAFAEEGVDQDFQRGRTAYDQYYGSPVAKPNPNLGTIEKGPFRALKIYPGDLGTKGGLVTDEDARVLDKKGKPIVGLYAAGNNTASVMGRTYPGPGSTIAPASIFGYLGALHAAQPEQRVVIESLKPQKISHAPNRLRES